MGKLFIILCAIASLPACTNRLEHNPLLFDATPVTTGIIEGRNWRSRTVVYHCQPDTELQVAYLNFKNGESFAAIYYQGLLSLMQNRPAGSGARYIAVDEQKSLRWHTKGDSGMLSFRAADHTADEQILLAECVSKIQ